MSLERPKLHRRELHRPGRPTLVLLHGLGSTAEDLFGVAMQAGIDASILSLQAPILYGPGFSWFNIDWTDDGLQLDLEGANQAIEMILAEIQSIGGEVILGGFSQGAMISAGVLARSPESLAGAILLSGALLPGTEISDAAHRPVLIEHGRQDPVVRFEFGEEMVGRFGPIHDVDFFADEVGHTVSFAGLVRIREWATRHFGALPNGNDEG